MRIERVLPVIGVLFSLVFSLRAEPEASSPSEPADASVRFSMERGVEFFRALSTNDSDGWFVAPYRLKKLVGTKRMNVYYKEVLIPDYEYELYEELVPGASPGDPMRKVTRQRVKREIPGQYHKMQVRDPSGPIIKEEDVGIWDAGGPDNWGYGKLGANAMVLFALNRAGVPFTDPLVARVADNLGTLVERLGVPDSTWDAAWMTAAFSVMPGDRFSNLTVRAASKLMEGQIRKGPATGLWGPVSVNTEFLSALMKAAGPLSDKATSGDAKGGKGTARALQAEAGVRNELVILQAALREVSWAGAKLFGGLGWMQVSDEQNMSTIELWGALYLFHNQTTADLESTALSLFALRVAADAGRLPVQARRPDLPRSVRQAIVKASVLQPVRSADVLQRAGAALAKARAADGTWNEMNLHQPVDDFQWLKSIPPALAKDFALLPSVSSGLTTLEGSASERNVSLATAGRAKGKDLPVDPASLSALEKWLEGDRSDADFAGSNTGVYAALFFLANVPGGPAEIQGPTGFSSASRVAQWLCEKQDGKTGAWDPGGQSMFVSTSVLARRSILPDPGDKLHEVYQKPHVVQVLYAPAAAGGHFTAGARIPCTAYALMALSRIEGPILTAPQASAVAPGAAAPVK